MHFKQQAGFSLIEWMIAIVLGLFITAGVSSLFVAGQRTTDDTFQFGEMQEQGRFALELLSRDIRYAGFFGDFTGNLMRADAGLITPAQPSPSKQCLDDKSLPTFPTSTGEYRSIWAMRVSATGTVNNMGCILDNDTNTDLRAGSMVLSIKRVKGQAVECSDADSSRYYLAANSSIGEIIKGSSVSSGCASLAARVGNMRLWEFQHHVYYLDRLENSDGTVTPQLRQMELKVHGSGDGMYRDSGAMVQGIEDMNFMFGVDLSGDGEVNRFLPFSEVTEGDWDQQRIVALQLFLLVRSRKEGKAPYKNTAKYQMGDRTVIANDRFKRMLFNAIVPIRNQVLMNAG